MRILYESDLAGSSYHGMAYRIFQFSSEFKRRGHEVMIVAASYSHVRRINPEVKRVITDENIDGIVYRWIRTPKYKGNNIGRVLHMFVYNFRLWYYARKIARDFNPDMVISSGVSPLDFIGCHRIAKKAGAKILLEVGDLWPLTPVELGNYSSKHPFIRFMQFIEDFSYRNTDGVISLLPCAEDYMIQHGLASNKFHHIPNGVDLMEWKNKKPVPPEYEILISDLKSKGNTLIAYTGSHGVANALDSLIDVAVMMRNINVTFLLLGSGPEKKRLEKKASSLELTNLFFLDSIPKHSIQAFLEKMDILYIGLQKQPLFRFGISPNKLFDYMMAGKPIIQAIDAGNNLVKEADCGVCAEPENVGDIYSSILRLKEMPAAERERLGNNGHKFVIENHSYDILTDKFLDIIKKLISSE